MYEASNFSISLSTLVIVGFYFWHARIYDVVSRCAFDLKFPNNDFPVAQTVKRLSIMWET